MDRNVYLLRPPAHSIYFETGCIRLVYLGMFQGANECGFYTEKFQVGTKNPFELRKNLRQWWISGRGRNTLADDIGFFSSPLDFL